MYDNIYDKFKMTDTLVDDDDDAMGLVAAAAFVAGYY